jgi:hypothetical protein
MLATADGAGTPTAPHTVSLVGGAAEPIPSAWPILWMTLIAAGVIVSALGVIAYSWSRLDPVERAFCLLAFRLGMKRRDRVLVRELAGRMEVQPVALLISARAFAEAISRATRTGLAMDPMSVERVRARVFG